MTEQATNKSLRGAVNNGRRGLAAFTFLPGGPVEVGIRQRGDLIEVACFGKPVAPKLPIEALVDGERVLVVAVTCRPLDLSASGKIPTQATCVINVTCAAVS